MLSIKTEKYIPTKEAVIHVLLWLLFFSMVNVSWTSSWIDRSIRPDTPAPLSILAFFAFFYINANWLIPKFLKGGKAYQYFLAITSFALALECIRALFFVIIQAQTASFADLFIEEFSSRDSFLLGSPSPIWFAFLLSSAYRFTKDWVINNRTIERLKAEKTTMQLSLLKAQINPHFLFNNLNALDDLIDRDTERAKKYLHNLSKMYRYAIQSSDYDVVNLEEEWQFIDDYIYLIEERFGKAYQFDKTNELSNLSAYLIPPASLQSLLENAIKHNEASIDRPLIVSIKADKAGISVNHLKRPKTANIKSLGTGLKNLQSRYELLSNQAITIIDAETFTVSLPLIKKIL